MRPLNLSEPIGILILFSKIVIVLSHGSIPIGGWARRHLIKRLFWSSVRLHVSEHIQAKF
ncbi:hypothetical protein BDV19DRAFT_355669 [Aspergillus venezuelensis]